MGLDTNILPSTWDLAYKQTIVASNLRNPNGCRMPMTWFTCCCWHGTESGDCNVVQQAYALGHDLATHTMSHSEETLSFSFDQWAEEIGGQRDWLVNQCGIPFEEVEGFRAPHFAVNNLMGEVLGELQFGYDSSLTGFPETQAGWLNGSTPAFDTSVCDKDEKERAKCGEWDGLPFWEVPAYILPGNFRRTDPPEVDGMSIVERLQADFERKRGTGVPVTVNVHERYLAVDDNRNSVVEFLQWVARQPGTTWALTYKQYKEWLAAPPGTSVEDVVSAYPCDDS